MKPIERVCDVLECVLLNGPISFRDLSYRTMIGRFVLAGDLVALADAGFVEIDPPLRQACDDPIPPMSISTGGRLRLIVDNVRAPR